MRTDAPPIEPAGSALRRLSLRKNFSWTFVGSVVYTACQWGILLVLTKLGSPTMVGQYALAAAVCAPIVIFCQLSLRPLQVTDAKNEYLFHQYFGLRLLSMCVAVAVSAGIGFVAYETTMGLLIFLLAVNQGVAACRDIFFGAMQKHERMDILGIGQMISGVVNLAFLGGAIFLTGSLHVAIAIAIVTKLQMLLLYDRPRVSRLLKASAGNRPSADSLRPSFAASAIWRLTKQALPLGLVMMLITASTSSPRYFIEALHGQKALGYFAAIASLLQVGTLVVRALGQSASPRLAKYYLDNVAAFKRLVIKLLAVGIAMALAGVVGAALLGRVILAILFTEEYAEYNGVLVIVMVSAAALYVASFFGYAMTAARYLKVQVPINIAVLAVTLLGSWLLIPPYGLWGAGFALIGAAIVRLIMQGAVVMYVIKARERVSSMHPTV